MSASNPNDVLLVVMSVDLGGGESGDIHIYQLDDPHDLALEFIRKRGLDGETLIPGEDGQVRLIDRLEQYIGELHWERLPVLVLLACIGLLLARPWSGGARMRVRGALWVWVCFLGPPPVWVLLLWSYRD